MRNYLSLVPISAKVHRRQSRMTILCIVISVLLVTAIFSIADMFIRTESGGLQEKHGNWHIQVTDVSQDVGEEISQRSDVEAVGWAESFNSDAEQPYYIGEKRAALYGVDDVYLNRLVNALEEGDAPQNDHEVCLSSNAKLALDVQIGDAVTVQTPAGDVDFTISGFGSDDSEYYRGQTYLVAVYMTRTAFTSLMEQNGIQENPTCYIQFESASKAADAITEFEQQYHLPAENISENTVIMGLSGYSDSKSVKNIYGIAAVLFVLVLLAGVLMISGSMNSNVAQRTSFFDMMRCIGASRKQIIRYVRLEALNWCKTAVPTGVISGVTISCGVCALLHYGIGGEFATMPVFALSPVGIICGVLVGIVTVLLASQAPAKRAARVSPMAAVAGNEESALSVHHASKLSFGKIERTLGVHHATNSKKNWFLITASFSLSIILMLCFSVGLDFARELMPSLQSWYPDITLNGYANALVLEQDLIDEISTVSGVESVYGSSYMDHVPAASSREGIDHVNLASYSDFLLDSAADSVMEGDISAIYGDTNQVMTISI
ncbi:MAG: ABC transporter permease [Eubacteriales bacterium]|nr:ABC transporter permease [Eubacteriales bacterium]